MISNDPGEEIRTGGDIGHIIGHVVRHPRIAGYWLAMWPPLTPRDCGMKKYKTRRGAVSRVRREWAAALEKAAIPQRLQK